MLALGLVKREENMAANWARRTLNISSASTSSLLSRSSSSSSFASAAIKFRGFASAKPTSTSRSLFTTLNTPGCQKGIGDIRTGFAIALCLFIIFISLIPSSV